MPSMRLSSARRVVPTLQARGSRETRAPRIPRGTVPPRRCPGASSVVTLVMWDERSRGFRWAGWSDDELLELPLGALGVSLRGTWVERCVHRLHAELARREIRFQPRVWASEEWFSP